jgi:hypothetical protein
VFVEPVTVAVNCWLPDEETVAEAGETEIDTTGGAAGAATVRLTEADFVLSA